MTITIDPTSGKAIPQTTAEWVELLALAGVSKGPPVSIYRCQDAGPDLADSGAAANPLVGAGTGAAFQQAISGWTSKAVTLAQGDSNRFANTVPDASTSSIAVLHYVAQLDVPISDRIVLEMGNVNSYAVTRTAVQEWGIGSTGFGSGSTPTGDVIHPFFVISNIATIASSHSSPCYTDDNIIDTDWDLYGGTGFSLGDTFGNTAGVATVYMAIWEGADAEFSQAEVQAILQAAGWSVEWAPGSWNLVSYTVPYTDPVNVESLAVLPSTALLGNAAQYTGFFQDLDWFGEWPSGISQPVLLSVDPNVYLCGYPDGVLYIYDPLSTWAPDGTISGNPSKLGDFAVNCDIKYCYFLRLSTNGNLYACGRRERDAEGTGIGAYNIAGATFGVGTTAGDLETLLPRGFVVLDGISRVAFSCELELDSPLPEAKIYVFDRDTLAQVAAWQVFAGITNTGFLFTAPDDPNVVIGFTAETPARGYRLNVTSGVVELVVTMPDQFGAFAQNASFIYTCFGTNLTRIDPLTLGTTIVGTVDIDTSILAIRGTEFGLAVGATLYKGVPG